MSNKPYIVIKDFREHDKKNPDRCQTVALPCVNNYTKQYISFLFKFNSNECQPVLTTYAIDKNTQESKSQEIEKERNGAQEKGTPIILVVIFSVLSGVVAMVFLVFFIFLFYKRKKKLRRLKLRTGLKEFHVPGLQVNGKLNTTEEIENGIISNSKNIFLCYT